MLRTRLAPLVGLLAGAALLSACRNDATEDDNRGDVASNLTNIMPLPETSPTIDRAALLAAIGEAASAYAAGTDDMAAQRALAGRRFAFRMAFGCNDEQAIPKDAPLRLNIRADGKSYEARARFSIDAEEAGFAFTKAEASTASDKAAPAAKAAVETVEGFWIERPWLLAEQCPKEPAAAPDEPTTEDAKDKDAADAPAPLPPREHSAGIAQYFTPADSRVGTRAGRDYVKVVTLAEGQTAPKGMMLLVEGRLRAWPDGKIIECRDSRTGGRPVCIAGITVDRVAFERADDRTVVAEWTN